jgi:hypothetical protein
VVTADIRLHEWATIDAELIAPDGTIIPVLSRTVFESGSHSVDIDLSKLSSGRYLLLIRSPYGGDLEELVLLR